MEVSKRHHYIPRFLIKNFADDNNMLWVYDKKKQKILKTQQSPKAIFFEWGRNLFDVNGTPGDNIEKMYAFLDDTLSGTVDKILATQAMTGRELTWLIFLAGLMKWRVPKADVLFRTLTRDVPIADLGLKFRPADPGVKANAEAEKRIEEMDVVRETKRLLLAIQPLAREDVLHDIHKNCFIVSYEQFPGLLGDCPIVESPNDAFNNLENFIFPLSSYDTLVCKRGSEKYISESIFYAQKDLAIFHLSEKFVACKDRNYLEDIANTYGVLASQGKAHLIQKYIFEFVK